MNVDNSLDPQGKPNDGPVSPVIPDSLLDYSKHGSLEQRQNAIKEEAFRISPLERSPGEMPVLTSLTYDDFVKRTEALMNPLSNGPLFPTPFSSTSESVEPPIAENVDALLTRLKDAKITMLCYPLPLDVAWHFIARQKTPYHLYPPGRPVSVSFHEEVDYFHVPWMLLYSIVQMEFSMKQPAFFRRHFLMEFVSFPPLVAPVAPSPVASQAEYIVDFHPQAWSFVQQRLDMLARTVNRGTWLWTGKQVQNYFTTATRLIRQEFPEHVREGIALRIRLSNPSEYPCTTPSYLALKSAMEAGNPLPLPDFEVVRCLYLGDVSEQPMADIVGYLANSNQQWFMSDKLIATVCKTKIYSPTGSIVSLEFGSPLPFVTSKITQMLDSYNQGYGFVYHGKADPKKRKLAEDFLDADPDDKRVHEEELSDLRIEKKFLDICVSTLNDENERLREQLVTIMSERQSFNTRVSALTGQIENLELQLEIANAQKLHASTRVTTLQQEIEQFKQQGTVKSAETVYFSTRVTELEQENLRLKGQLDISTAEKQSFNTRLHHFDEQISQLRQELAILKNEQNIQPDIEGFEDQGQAQADPYPDWDEEVVKVQPEELFDEEPHGQLEGDELYNIDPALWAVKQ